MSELEQMARMQVVGGQGGGDGGGNAQAKIFDMKMENIEKKHEAAFEKRTK